mmetsp:Transcript_24070/g.66747  ORF Transcript_24070/g.66747 Transcript_24070/m.66747 type:complete len:298 (-) Transcript_24070:147-1040(-)
MSESESEYDGAEAYVKERPIIRRSGRPFSTDIEQVDEYTKYELLFKQVHNGAAQLLNACLGYKSTMEGQMGMIDFGDGIPQAVTALQNIVKRRGTTPKFAVCTFSGRRHNETFQVHFQHLGLPSSKIQPMVLTIGDESVSWEYGVDIAFGTFPAPAPTSSHQRYHVFQAIPQGYEYTAGTKIAMAIFTKQAATVESARITGPKDVDPTRVYGAPDEISVYAGIITEVGEKFFVHDINSYRGCSGALVFLLDGPDAGRCIGVHIGSPPDIVPAVNVAVMVRESPTLIGSPTRNNNALN